MKQTDSLDALRTEIEQKREFVARLEQERTDLELEIAAFEATYNADVKPLQDELDAINLHIQEYELRNELLRFRGNRLSAVQLEAEVELRLLGQRAQTTCNDTPPPHARQRWESIPHPVEPDIVTKAELKSLYRELAKRFHPDLATNDRQRESHGARMAEINDAYAHGDLEVLRHAADESDVRASLPPTLAELLAERDRLDALIIRLRQNIAELNRDPLMLLKIDTALARHSRRDLLAEMATNVHIKIVERRGELNRLIAEFRTLVDQVGLV
jgi:hypothetical protein